MSSLLPPPQSLGNQFTNDGGLVRAINGPALGGKLLYFRRHLGCQAYGARLHHGGAVLCFSASARFVHAELNIVV